MEMKHWGVCKFFLCDEKRIRRKATTAVGLHVVMFFSWCFFTCCCFTLSSLADPTVQHLFLSVLKRMDYSTGCIVLHYKRMKHDMCMCSRCQCICCAFRAIWIFFILLLRLIHDRFQVSHNNEAHLLVYCYYRLGHDELLSVIFSVCMKTFFFKHKSLFFCLIY